MKKKKLYFIGIVAFIIISFLIRRENSSVSLFPIPLSYELNSPSAVFAGKENSLYIISAAKKEIQIINQNRRITGEIKGGSPREDFYYASRVCDDEAGNIYVSDTVYNGEGTRISEENIFRFNKQGKKEELVYQYSYKRKEDMPMQYGNILSMKEKDGNLYLVRKMRNNTVALDTLSLSAKEMTTSRFEIPGAVIAADYHIENQLLVCTTRQGEAYALNCENPEPVLLQDTAENGMPSEITASDDMIYIADMNLNCIWGISYQINANDFTDSKEHKKVMESEESLHTADCNGNGVLVATDYAAVYVMQQGDSEVQCYTRFEKNGVLLSCIYWVMVLVSAGTILVCIILLLWRFLRILKDNTGFQRSLLIVIPSAVIVTISSALVLQYLVTMNVDNALRDINLCTSYLLEQLDGSQTEKLTDISDYQNDTYNEIKAPLDELTNTFYENEKYCYYILYRRDGDSVNAIMDYEDSLGVNQPAYSMEDEEYSNAFQINEKVINRGDASSYGSWIYVLQPVLNDKGKICAVLEVGENLDKILEEKAVLEKQIFFSSLTILVVFLMLSIEVVFYTSYREKRIQYPEHTSLFMPLRTLIFLNFLVDCMQDSFMAIVGARLYEPIWGIPKEMGAAFPISLELFFSAVFSLLAGKMTALFGTKKSMIIGFFAQMSGFIICAAFGSYQALLLGKSMIGVGMGIIYVTANTLAAMETDEGLAEDAFACIGAGTLSGVSIGAGLGTVVLAFSSYRSIYAIGAAILLFGVLISFNSKGCKSGGERKEKVYFWQFLLKKRVFTYFLFLLLPFMMSLSFREYFFPLYVDKFGMDEVSIGRIYLLCGVMTLYFGPQLSKLIITKLGRKMAVVFASLCMLSIMALFVALPCVQTAVAGVILLSVTVSFAYTCQYSYFGGLSECEAFGEGNSMGLYSIFENMGQTFGPIIYAAALMLGTRPGLLFLGAGMGILLLLFTVLNKRSVKSE